MILEFSENEIENKINIIEVEDIIVYGHSIEIKDDLYYLKGKAAIEGENYNNFVVEFSLVEKPTELTIKSILDVDWDEYDFIF